MTESIKQKAAKSSRKARLTAARLFAVQAVYQSIQIKVTPASLVDEYQKHRIGMDLHEGDEMVVPDGVLFSEIMNGLTARWDDVMGLIAPRLNNTSMEPLLTAILACGAYEILAHGETDAPIIIADYLHVTHGFFEGSEPKLVNGILDALTKELRS